MNAYEPLSDTELEAMLARLTARGRADGLEAAIMATVDTTSQRRGPWVRWPDWRLTPAPDTRLILRLAVVGLLLALAAGTLVVGSRLLERTPPIPVRLPPLLEGMVTEEVEPGVLRIVNDGVRDLSYSDDKYYDPSDPTVDVTPDGSVWLSSSLGLFRLGQEPAFGATSRDPAYLEVAPDGSLWAIYGGGLISSFDGGGWTTRTINRDTTLRFGALAIGPDGTVWVTAGDKYCSSDTYSDDCLGTVLMRLEDDGSLTAIEDWADVFDGDVSPDVLAVSPAGDVWLAGMVGGGWQGGAIEALLRFDGKVWELVPGPEGLVKRGHSLDIGPDGTLWMNASGIGPDGTLWTNAGPPDSGRLARFDDSGWTVFTEADGVEPWGGQGWIPTDLLTVAPDGSVWMNGNGSLGCGGVAHYDGTTWTWYLCESSVDDLAVAPDGSVWLRATMGGSFTEPGTIDTYVIRPETGATIE